MGGEKKQKWILMKTQAQPRTQSAISPKHTCRNKFNMKLRLYLSLVPDSIRIELTFGPLSVYVVCKTKQNKKMRKEKKRKPLSKRLNLMSFSC